VNAINARVVLVAAAALAWSTQALAARGFTEEFAAGTTRPKSIALLPVEASVVRARVVETEGLIDESVVYGEFYNTQLKKLLAEKGYEVQVIDADRINADPMLQEYVVDAKRTYDEILGQYRPKRLPKRIYNGGDSARLLAAHLGVDAIAFSKMSMTITPAGKAILSALVGGTTAGAFSSVGIIAGATGDLEAMQLGLAYVTPGEKTDEQLQAYVATMAVNTVKRIPGADPSDRPDESASGDEEVLDEVEALLKK
jgi:hypothetical protein